MRVRVIKEPGAILQRNEGGFVKKGKQLDLPDGRARKLIELGQVEQVGSLSKEKSYQDRVQSSTKKKKGGK